MNSYCVGIEDNVFFDEKLTDKNPFICVWYHVFCNYSYQEMQSRVSEIHLGEQWWAKKIDTDERYWQHLIEKLYTYQQIPQVNLGFFAGIIMYQEANFWKQNLISFLCFLLDLQCFSRCSWIPSPQ